jgi:hypothetical protein
MPVVLVLPTASVCPHIVAQLHYDFIVWVQVREVFNNKNVLCLKLEQVHSSGA